MNTKTINYAAGFTDSYMSHEWIKNRPVFRKIQFDNSLFNDIFPDLSWPFMPHVD